MAAMDMEAVPIQTEEVGLCPRGEILILLPQVSKVVVSRARAAQIPMLETIRRVTLRVALIGDVYKLVVPLMLANDQVYDLVVPLMLRVTTYHHSHHSQAISIVLRDNYHLHHRRQKCKRISKTF
jgi:hypothetical protein